MLYRKGRKDVAVGQCDVQSNGTEGRRFSSRNFCCCRFDTKYSHRTLMVRVWWLDPSLLVATHLYEADMSGVTLVSVSSGPVETVWPGDDSSCHLTLGLGNPWAEHWNLAVDPSSTLTSSSCSRLTVGATRISSLKQKNFQIIYSQHMELPLIAARLFHNMSSLLFYCIISTVVLTCEWVRQAEVSTGQCSSTLLCLTYQHPLQSTLCLHQPQLSCHQCRPATLILILCLYSLFTFIAPADTRRPFHDQVITAPPSILNITLHFQHVSLHFHSLLFQRMKKKH